MTVQNKIKILILDDEKQFTEELHEFFVKSGFQTFESNSWQAAQQILSEQAIDLLILDVQLPGENGIELLKEVKKQYADIEVIVVSAYGDMETVIQAIRFGAFDYLRKPFRHIDIQITIERTQKFIQLRQKLERTEEQYSLISKSLEDKIDRQFIGVSDQIQEVLEKAITASNYPDTNVLITGESGTGKENIARIIQGLSSRKNKMFCAVNSSAISESLWESEFFGHKKGAFTGAINDKIGLFELCNGGTLFLDEIADMPYNLQAKILRTSEEKIIVRVGDHTEIYTDFRIISATNHDIFKRVEEKAFRHDLLHRLNTLHIHISPLRERPEDIKPLLIYFVDFFANKFNKREFDISDDTISFLMKYAFPGNVRELRNMAERAIIHTKNNKLTLKDFPVLNHTVKVNNHHDDDLNLKMQEINLIQKALLNSQYVETTTAETLGISRDALIRKMKKYNIILRKAIL